MSSPFTPQHWKMSSMNSAAAPKDPPKFPLYFFDQVSVTVIDSSGSRLRTRDSFCLQPLKRNQMKRTRSILYFIAANEGSQLGDGRYEAPRPVRAFIILTLSFSSLQKGKGEDLSEDTRVRSAGGPDTPGVGVVSAYLEFQDREILELYRREAPLLLKELSTLLSQHKGEFPQGILNVLDRSWEDLTAGALVRRKTPQLPKPDESRLPPRPVTSVPLRKSPFLSDVLRKHIYIQGA